ncbi:hypothetical protein C8Q73DRAFT_788026 [Cubamyces lactineus]|nr:hypothetical protein C8Q73DRAFT_788026 [Cubamyces lactineus]
MTEQATLAGSNGPGILQRTNAGESAILRDGDYWFDDGNIVFVAKNHSAGARPAAFRVHKSVLFRHSAALSDLLGEALPQPTATETATMLGEAAADSETMDGCPAVYMSDSYHDFKVLFRALYDGSSFARPGRAMTPSEAAALVRLGHKYDIRTAFVLGIAGLNAVFAPKNVWDNQFQPSFFWTLTSAAEAVEAVLLRRLGGRYTPLLVTALFDCAGLTTQVLLQGAARADGHVERLALGDVERCLQFREWKRATLADWLLQAYLLPNRPGCQHPDQCDRALSQVCATTMRDGSGPAFPQWNNHATLCAWCRSRLSGSKAEYRVWLWHRLPEKMGLNVPGWQSFS